MENYTFNVNSKKLYICRDLMKKMKSRKYQLPIIIIIAFMLPFGAFGADTKGFGSFVGTSDDGNHVIQTPVAFLNIAPDSRGGGMGDIGAATSPDVNSMHWNPAKYAFIKDDAGIDISYTPWLRGLVTDINLAYLAGYKKIGKQGVLAGSFRYFSLGEILFRDEYNMPIGQRTPNELAVDVAISRYFSDNFSGGVALRFIRSDLSSGIKIANTTIAKAGTSVAADISGYYHSNIVVSGLESVWAVGGNISNIGSKIAYSDDGTSNFIPTNLKLGTALTNRIDNFNTITYAFEINKLLVPTPPVYATDSSGTISVNSSGNKIIARGMDDNVSPIQGIMQSFYDAPDGFKEELKEFTWSLGVEYWYANQFALRGGYFNESQQKGNRKYFTLGLGVKMNIFNLDFSYLVPTSGSNNPLANTMRFSLGFNFSRQKAQKKPAA
jgi:hypothetical protein